MVAYLTKPTTIKVTQEKQQHDRRSFESSARTHPDQENGDSGSLLNELDMRNLEDSSAHHQSAPDLSGIRLVRSVDFWLIFALLLICEWKSEVKWEHFCLTGCLSIDDASMGLVSGTGLLYINNIGAMVSTLNASNKIMKLDPEHITELQAFQVSTISAGNCIGRLCAGRSI